MKDEPIVYCQEESPCDLELSPNPTDGVMFSKIWSNRSDTLKVEVYSVQGKELIRREVVIKTGETDFQVDLSAQESGVYYVSVSPTNRSEPIFRRLIKE